MNFMKPICAVLLAASVAACSSGGHTNVDPNYSSGAKPSPEIPTGLGVDVVKEIYLKPGSKRKSGATPPKGYKGQWWTDPETNCEYSRGGFGGQVNWTLILNPPGKPFAKSSCMKHFVTEGPLVPGYRHVGNGKYFYDKSTDPLLQSRPMMPMDDFEMDDYPIDEY
jgi:hypothetical protein